MGGRFVLDRRHDKAQGLDRRSRASPFSVSLVTKNCCFGRESRGEPRWFIACQSCGEEVDVKAKGGDKVRKELDTKGDKAGIKKRPGYVWAKARQAGHEKHAADALARRRGYGPNRKSRRLHDAWPSPMPRVGLGQ